MPSPPSSAYEVVDPATLPKRLADHEWLEAPVTDGVSPLTVVDLTANAYADIGFDAVPSTTPRVFVAVGGDGSTARAACDVAVDHDDDPALGEIAATCEAAPRAASVAAQLLRTAEDGSIAAGFWRESVTYSMLLAGPEFSAWRDDYWRRRGGWYGHFAEGAPVTIEDDGDRFDIVLDRPRVHNAYNAAMRDGLVEVLRGLSAVDPLPAVRLRGNGPSFCSGGDLNEFGTTPSPVEAHAIRTSRAPGLLLHAFGPLASAYVHGACIGAGTELPAFCARVEAAPDARFCLPEVAMGLVPGAGGTVSVSRRIGRQRTALLALTGRTIDAPTALEWGLIDAVVPSG